MFFNRLTNMKLCYLFILLLFLSAFSNTSKAEGSKQMVPNANSRAYLGVRKGGTAFFAHQTSPESARLNFYIKSPSSEKVKLAFRHLEGTNDRYFRIKNPSGTVVFGPQLMPEAAGTGYIPNRAQNTLGPNGVIQEGSVSATTGSYTPFEFTPTAIGDHYIEFSRDIAFATTPNNNETDIEFWDIAVYNTITQNVLNGRLWSKNWVMDTGSFNISVPFEGKFFVYSSDSITTSIDFLGIAPGGFQVACNESGVTFSGNTAADVISDRQSVNGANSVFADYKLFVNEPEESIYPSGLLGELNSASFIRSCGAGDFCAVVDATKKGLATVLINLNGIPGYQVGTKDVLIEFWPIEPGFNCVPWDGLDAFGAAVPVGTSLTILVDYQYGITHLPLFDIEQNPGGFTIELVRPSAPTPQVYWDDTYITDTYGTAGAGQVKDNTDGVSGVAAHKWNNTNFGNENTVNTYWFIAEAFRTVSVVQPPPKSVDGGLAQTVCIDTTNIVYLDGTRVETETSQWTTTGTGYFFPSDTALNPIYVPSTADYNTGSVTLAITATDLIICTTITDDVIISFISGSCFQDTDGDGIADNIDIDDDNDGILDVDEFDGISDPGGDNDGDGDPNYLDLDFPGFVDVNNDFLNDNFDQDLDGVPDHYDLDSDNDGILDLTEAGHGELDSDNDGRLDTAVGANGLVDVLETAVDNGTLTYTIANTDSDGNLDYLDIDADGDGIVDNIEAQVTGAGYIAPTGNDTDGDGIDDAYDGNNGGTYITPVDSELAPDETTATPDGTPDYLDLDSDNDGVPDVIEGHDANINGLADTTPTGTDSDGDGLDDAYDTVNGYNGNETTNATGSNSPLQDTDGLQEPDWRDVDDDDDGTITSGEDRNTNGSWFDDFTQEGGTVPDYLYNGDNDGDGISNASDPDDDNDGILDIDEGFGIDPSADADGDGLPNFADPTFAGFIDSNGDGVNDNFDADLDGIPNHFDLDSDNDGVPDAVEAGGTAIDANGDGIVDGGLDTDNDGILDPVDDSCDASVAICLGVTIGNDLGLTDSDSDGVPNAYDLDSDNDGIQDIIEAGGTDANGDGKVDVITDSDINGFADIVDTGNGGTKLDNKDTDGDGILDTQDRDSDNDGIADIVEAGGTDANGNGEIDTITDTDGDGWSNLVDAGNGGTSFDFDLADADGDGIYNFQDLDSDNDGIPDIVEGGLDNDADGDGKTDTFTDTDGDGFADLYDTSNGGTNHPITNTDSDGFANYLDIDSDNDGIVDNIEGQLTASYVAPSNTDTDGDGIDDAYDTDCTPCGVITGVAVSPVDTDGNANDNGSGGVIPDYLDTDSDDDGIVDLIEGHDGDFNGIPSWDSDGDYPAGTPTASNANTQGEFTEETGALTDSDNDGLLDIFDTISGAGTTNNSIGSNASLQDTDGTEDKDWRDTDDDGDGTLTSAEDDNTNGNWADDNTQNCSGRPDYLCSSDEDQDGISNLIDLDDDNDGIPDSEESPTLTIEIDPLADEDGDGTLNWEDSDTHGFVDSGAGTHATFDTNGDGTIDISIPTNITAIALAGDDYDGDGVLNYEDVDLSGGFDLNLDGVNDNFDRDLDGIPDFYDLDSDNDGISDTQEVGHSEADADGDGRLDGDVGTNGLVDALETVSDNGVLDYTVLDTDGDGIDDYRDLDSDNDGIPDVVESSGVDADFDGIIDSFIDSDNDGLADSRDTNEGNALFTTAELDKDGDGIPNHRDLDSDNDGIQDVVEAGGTDTDGNGIVDGATTDSDGNGLYDSVDLLVFGSPLITPDTDGDGIRNFLDLDSDGDGITDYIESGLTTTDAGNDGIVDGFTDAGGNINGWNDTTEGTLSTAITNTDGDANSIFNFIDPDSDDDGILDNIEGQTTAGYIAPTGTDTDGDGIDDAYDADCTPCGAITGAPISPENTDGLAEPDYTDLDSDDDGVLDIIEGHDSNQNGFGDWDTTGSDNILSVGEGNADTDGDGLLDAFDTDCVPCSGVTGTTPPLQNTDGTDEKDWRDTDDDNDGILTSSEDDNTNGNFADDFAQVGNPGTTPDYLYIPFVDSDGDGIDDTADLDSDNDGILDSDEDGGTGINPSVDADGDGIPNYKDSDLAGFTDANGDGTDDRLDADGDGIPDFLDLDSDNDGIPDIIEAGGADADGDGRTDGFADSDNDGLADAFDADCDGIVVASFGNALSGTTGTLSNTANAIDGNNATFAELTANPSSIDIDLGQTVASGTTITVRISRQSGSGSNTTEGEILQSANDITYSNGQAYNVGATASDESYVITADTRFIRITMTDNNDAGVHLVSYSVAPCSGIVGVPLGTTDSDNDGIDDAYDLDSDNDGITDLVEVGGTDANGDGQVDVFVDTDNDGLADAIDGDVGNDGTAENTAGAIIVTGADTDGDGRPNSTPNGDADGDLKYNFQDIDSDNDGIVDNIESQTSTAYVAPTGTDTDGDGIDDAYDTDCAPCGAITGIAIVPTDTDSDVNDNGTGHTIADYLDTDSDNDGVLDLIEGHDANSNGHPDWDTDNDYAGSASTATVPFVTEFTEETGATVDTDGDGLLDIFDNVVSSGGTVTTNITGSNAPTQNTDGTDNPDWRDTDDDNDGIVTGSASGGVNGNGTGEEFDTDGNWQNDQNDTAGTPDYLNFLDQDKDGIADATDLDSDNDGILDSDEDGGTGINPSGDADGDGIPNYEDTDIAGFVDDNGDGVDDRQDADGDGIPNFLDLDSDNDGITDVIENGGTDVNGDGISDGFADTDGDGIPDSADVDIIGGGDTDGDGISDTADVDQTGGTDADGDGIDDNFDPDTDGDGLLDLIDPDNGGTALPTVDTDGDGVDDAYDLDSDNDGIPDVIEAGGADADGNGTLDGAFADADNDGVPDSADATLLGNGDADGDGVDNSADADFTAGTDTDGNGILDAFDPDDDNDGIADIIDPFTDGTASGNTPIATTGADTDDNGTPDSFSTGTIGLDTDGDGIVDWKDLDSDGDGIPDVIEAGGVDVNGDGILDGAGGGMTDTDGDGLLDTVDGDNGATALVITGADTDSDGQPNSIPTANDTDQDGIVDWEDLDSDNDGISDIIEAGGADANGDGKADGTADADGNGFNDVYDPSAGTPIVITGTDGGGDGKPDAVLATNNFDGDGFENWKDIDADNDGIVDNIEAQATASYIAPTGLDADNDGIDDAYDGNTFGTALVPVDTDADANDHGTGGALPDYIDYDSDNDNVLDLVEGHDVNSNGQADWDTDTDYPASAYTTLAPFVAEFTEETGATVDTDGDGLLDIFDNVSGIATAGNITGSNASLQNTDNTDNQDWRDTDDDNDGILTSAEDTDNGGSAIGGGAGNGADGNYANDLIQIGNPGTPDYLFQGFVDKDGDLVADINDLDSDNDGILDTQEDGGTGIDPSADADGDGRPNYTDSDLAGFTDSNGDGVDDRFDTDLDGIPDFHDLDSDNDGIPDVIEVGGVDTNGDGILDGGADSDGDGIPDSADVDVIGGGDTDGDGISDTADIDETGGIDTDGDGVDDNFDTDVDGDGLVDTIDGGTTSTLTAGGVPDTDGDGIADNLDLDSDNDGITDVIEAGGADANGDGILDGTFADTDGDGFADIVDGNVTGGTDGTPITVTGADTDADGIPNSTPIADDQDGDGVPNWQDLDSDNDGITDVVEAGGVDTNGDGLLDTTGDTDGDGLVDAVDGNVTGGTDGTPLAITGADTDNDGTPNSTPSSIDSDQDGIADWLDLDSDGDGIPDVIEAGGVDTNGDGLLDSFADTDGDGLADDVDPTSGATSGSPASGETALVVTGTDTDSDGKPNSIPITNDTDGDDVPDWLDRDSDNDGITDVIEAGGIDTNGDGIFDGFADDADGDGLADLADPTTGATAGSPASGETAIVVTGIDTDSDGEPNSTPTENDTDGDGIADWQDLDSDNDGITDAAEAGLADLDGDGLVDAFYDLDRDGLHDLLDPDVVGGTAGVVSGTDTNADGEADNVPTANNPDGDGFANWQDRDSDDDGIADVIEAGGTDANGDGIADNFTDTDNDGWNDIVDGDANNDGIIENLANVLVITGTDTDSDGIPNSSSDANDSDRDGLYDWIDLDSDGDGIADVVEAYGFTADGDGDGILGTGTPADTDGDGFNDGVDSDNGGTATVVTDTDGNADGAPDAVLASLDNDGDGREDWKDIDADNDGIVDNFEGQTTAGYTAPTGTDTDGDGLDDAYDADNGGTYINPTDTDGDADDQGSGGTIADYLDNDSDNDGVIDLIEGHDANSNGIPDWDTDGDYPATIPTETSTSTAGFTDETGFNTDTDGDGLLDIFDNVSGISTTNNVIGSNADRQNSDGLDERDWRDTDDDNDGLLTSVEDNNTNGNWADDAVQLGNPATGTPDYLFAGTIDSDKDGIADATDLDSDNDGIIDTNEDGGTGIDPSGDSDSDGIPNYRDNDDPLVSGLTDADSDGIYDAFDSDSDGIPDFLDRDSDNDGITDAIEVGGADANGDGILDDFEDDDADGIPNSVDVDFTGGTDADTDGIDDTFDFSVIGGTDTDGDGIEDAFDIDADGDGLNGNVDGGTTSSLVQIDTDGDGIPNSQDLDSDNDGIADIIEAGGTDADSDGKADGFVDADNDGLSDSIDPLVGAITTGTPFVVTGADTDSDGQPNSTSQATDQDSDNVYNWLDLDSDNDGVADLTEANGTDSNNDGIVDTMTDTDGDGIPDVADFDILSTGDADADGIDNSVDVDFVGGTDTDGDGIVDTADPDANGDGWADVTDVDIVADADGDGLPNRLDLDSDDDGITDLVEAGLSTTLDADNDGIVDGADADGDGLKDNVDTSSGNNLLANADTDGDSVPNSQDLDADNDGIADILEGTSPTETIIANTNGVIDGVDSDGDGLKDAIDPDSGNNPIVPNNQDGDARFDFVDLDTDNDGISDVAESNGTDANNDGVFDGADTDGDGLIDGVDTDSGNSLLTPPNSDTDVPLNPTPGGATDLADFRDLDSDSDGISDIIENGGTDADKDGVADGGDADNDGIKDVSDVNSGNTFPAEADFDGDGVPNYADQDTDNDGIADFIEAQLTGAAPDGTVANAVATPPENFDSDGDGINDAYDEDITVGNYISPLNFEGSGLPDYQDLDTDDDTEPDFYEGFDDNLDSAAIDDLSTRANAWNVASGVTLYDDTDTDGDGRVDWMEIQVGGRPAYLTAGNAYFRDTDNDGLIDLFDTDNFGSISQTPDFDVDILPDFRDTPTPIPLPIELLFFTATNEEDMVRLDWASATEINSDYFDVERSGNGTDFEKVGVVKASGDSKVRVDYQLFDLEPLNGISYYRLKAVDADESFEYSRVVQVARGVNVVNQQYQIFPNPAKIGEDIFVSGLLGVGNILEIEVYSVDGKSVQTLSVGDWKNDGGKLKLDFQQIPTGIYLLKVIEVNGNTSILRVNFK
jgi:hypothetical protein